MAILSAMFSRAYLADLRRAHRERDFPPDDALFPAESADVTDDALFPAESADTTDDALFPAESADTTVDDPTRTA